MSVNLKTDSITIILFIILLSTTLFSLTPGVSAQYPNNTSVDSNKSETLEIPLSNNDTPGNASLSVDRGTYVLNETVFISLTAPPKTIVFFNITSPAGIIYSAVPSTDGEYQFKPDIAGTYVVNVLLRTDGDEKFLAIGFEVIDTDPEVVFGKPKQGAIELGEPVTWSQHISITNHGRFSISNFSVSIPLPAGHSNLSSDGGFSITNSSIPVDLAAGEDVRFNISYQTPLVRIEVVEEDVDIYDLIPPDAFDIGIYRQIGAEDVSFPSLSTPIEVRVKRVKVWHNSSTQYRDIPITIAIDEGERLFEIVDGTEMEVSVDITDGTASWMIPKLSNRTFTMRGVDRKQGDAEIDKPVEWQLNVSGAVIRYRTPAPYRIESEEALVNGTWRKEMIIGSNASVHYRDVTAFTTLNETAGSNIKLFLLGNGSRVDVTDDPAYNVSLLDRNDNSIPDEIRWNVPLHSLKRFEVEYGYVSIRTVASLTSKRGYFGPDEEPEFIFKYMDEKRTKKALMAAAAENESIKTFVYNYKGELTDIGPEIEDLGGGAFSIKLPVKRAFRAGIYKLKVELERGGVTYTQEEEFRWGLVSLNTRRSIYRPGEAAEFIIVVLDENGYPVCDADISMVVTAPDGEGVTHSTGNGAITGAGESGIYTAAYLIEVEGNHTIDITASVNGVEVSFSTHFLVQRDYEFEIIRTAQSKIDPTKQDWFDVKIDIESFTEAKSVTIKEFVPASFNVSTDAATVLLEDDTKTITWNKDFSDNKTSVSYSYSVPHIWPYLYALGPAEIDYRNKTFSKSFTYTEARPWYVAVDPSAPAVDAVTTNSGDANLFTHSHTVSGSNRLLVVEVALDDGAADKKVSSVTYAGTSLTRLTEIVYSDDGPRVDVWYLVNPPTGANNVVVTQAGENEVAIGAISYTGVNQITPIDGTTTAQGASASASISVTSETDDLVTDVMASVANGAPSVGPGQTQRWNVEMGGSGETSQYGAGSTEAGASSVTMSWTLPESKEWVIAGFNINAVDTTAPTFNCECGDICVNTSGWWRGGGTFNASNTPIQAAVDNVTAGETVYVYNGSYTENVNVSKRLTLRGEGVDVVNVTASLAGEHVFEVTVDYVNISGFNVIGAGTSKAGIYLNGRQHCSISDNNASGNYYGIYLQSSSNNTLTNNTASNNNQRGIYLQLSSNNMLTSNNANSNGNCGIYLSSSSNNMLTNNTASNNIFGIYMSSASNNNTLTSNTVNSNDWFGIYLSSSNINMIYNNYFNNTQNAQDYGNNIWNTTPTPGTNIIGGSWLGGNYWSGYTGNDTNEDDLGDTLLPYTSLNRISNGGDYHPLVTPGFAALTFNCECGDICVNETGWWRDGGVLNASNTPIQAAIDNATAGETVYVYNGSYIENVDVSKRLTLRGEGADVVNVTASSAGEHVFEVTVDYVNISGFNVIGATGSSKAGFYLSGRQHCNISDNNASGNYCGIYLYSSSNNNTLTSNTADSNNYYGIYLYDSSNNNTLTSNTAGLNSRGIYLSSSSNNTLTSNTADSNTGYGIYLYDSSNNNTLTSNTADSNTGYGIYLSSSSNNNTLTNNTADSNSRGIWLFSSSNNTLTSNTANSNNDYGIYMYYSSNNNTLTNNTANSNSRGIYLSSSSNNTLTSNTADLNNNYGVYLYSSKSNMIYNNYFNYTNNARDDGHNTWNTTPTPGTNIIGGSWLGGNYWSDYAGADTTGDSLGDTLLPYNSSDNIQNGGDYHPLVTPGFAAPTFNCECGDICVNETGWWRGGGVLNGSYMPIQAAVDNATAGETIYVYNGSYSENVNVDKRVTLEGEDADVVTVTAANPNDHVFNVTVDYVNIYEFNVIGATGLNKSGICLGDGVDYCNISDNNVSNSNLGIVVCYSSNNNTLANNTANSNTQCGIVVYYLSNNNTLANNTANSNTDYGIYLWYSSNNNLTNNTADSNGYGIYLDSSCNYNTLTNNTANSNSDSGIYLDSSSNNNLTNNNANSNTQCGIYLDYSSNNNTLTNNTAYLNDYGVVLSYYSSNNNLTNNTAYLNDYGVVLYSYSSNNTLTDNTVNSGTYGIYLQSSSNNTFTGNTVSNNYGGILLTSSSNYNTLTNNTVYLNNYGIDLYSSNSNTIYNNYFNNTYNAYDDGNNIWNITPSEGTNIIGGSWLSGNYWFEYAGSDTNGDGLGDTLTPYNSSGNITNGGDYHPLVTSGFAAPTFNCTCGDICVNTSGWWRGGGVFNGSNTPIQAAIDNAIVGETVYVYNGSYIENVNVNKRLTLRGEGADVVTVTAANPNDHVFNVTVDYVNIYEFNVIGATGLNKSGICLGDGVDYCNISDNNVSNSNLGIVVCYSSNNNTLANNTASNTQCGIVVYYSSNYNTLTNNTANSNTDYGIYLWYSSNNTLTNNTANSNTDYGIYLDSSSNNNTLTNNTANSNSDRGIYLDSSSNYNTLTNNTANNNSYYGIILSSSSNNNTLTNNTANSNSYGILLYNPGNYNTLTNNTANSNNKDGIYLYNSTNNILTNNTANLNTNNGIYLSSSSNNTLANNTANLNTNYSIFLYSSSSNNTLTCNTASDNYCGIFLYSSSNHNTLTSNTASDNYYGVYLYNSSNNTIYNNYFNNTQNANDDRVNTWNTTPTAGTNIIGGSWLGGNYWSDYAGADTTGDGLGDTLTPYNSSSIIQHGGDYHPLVTPGFAAPTFNCTCGDICVNTSGWWRGGGVFNGSNTPIQAAIDNATAGETVYVYNGSYIENVNLNKRLTLAGEGAGVVNVTSSTADYCVFEVTADYVNISGFNVTGATGSSKAGFYLSGRQHCNISDNNASGNYCGIYLTSSSNNTLTNNTANSNNNYGIQLKYSSNYNTLTNNTANSNNNYGIYMRYSSNYNMLTNNTADSNNYGIYLDSSSNNTLASNTADSNNYYGIYLYSSSNYNTLASNTISDNTWDLYLKSSASSFTNNTLNGTMVSLTYSGDVSLKGVGSPASDTIGWNNITKFISATNQSAGAWLLLNFTYSDADVSGLVESNLKVWKHNGTAWVEDGWNGSRYLDAANNVVGVNITSFSVFAPMTTSGDAPVVTLIRPENGSSTSDNRVLLNATVTDADDDNMTVYFYANNNSNSLNASGGLVYIAQDVENGSTVTYNLTALPIKPSEDNLLLLMHFDNRSVFGEHTQRNVANAVYDFSGNGNNGTLGDAGTDTAPTWNVTGGRFAGAFEFDGTDDYLCVNNHPSLRITGPLTLEAWVNFNSLGSSSDYKGIVTKWNHSGSGWGYGLLKDRASDKIAFHLASGANSGNTIVESDSVPSLHAWHHVVGTYDGTNMLLYINGEIQTDTNTIAGIYDNSEPVTIGTFEKYNNFYFNGKIDEVAIYNRSLSASEILDHYRLREGKYYWKVNATDGVLSNESEVWNFYAGCKPDLRVINVTFDHWDTAENRSSISETGTDYHVKENRNIMINATIANYANRNVTSNFNVSFFDSAGVYGNWSRCFWNFTYNVSTEGELGNVTTGYPYNTTYVTGYWNPSLVGTHNISVWVNPANSASESAANTTNNNKSAVINVSAWQKYYGNVSGGIALADSTSESLYDWTWSNETDVGYAYIVKDGVAVNWSALHALGCDSDDTLNASGKDFLDADTNLGMVVGSNNVTGFADNNITELFSGGDLSNATNTTSFTVYGTSIPDVPIVNSTDMTNYTSVESANFVTGILWDATRDTNGYYDTTDNETLVFVTKIRVATTGIGSAVHNYEFAAPCTLNPAVGGDLDIYVELK